MRSELCEDRALLQKTFIVLVEKRFLVLVLKTDTLYVIQKINRL
jgi:hypothetical protein